jgi:hypothetical protein
MQSLSICRRSLGTNSGRSPRILIPESSAACVAKLNSFARNILQTSSFDSKFYPDFAPNESRKSFASKDLAA